MHHRFSACARLAATITLAILAVHPSKADSQISWRGAMALEQAYDSNVFLQSEGESANEHSWVTTIAPQVSASWKMDEKHTAALAYAPTFSWYSAASSENNIAHRLTASSTYAIGPMTLQITGSDSVVDGDREGLVWTAPAALRPPAHPRCAIAATSR